ncbi:MAG: LEPR-XLL domain-containing protein, partial [Gammaproteobacteria bacterium]
MGSRARIGKSRGAAKAGPARSRAQAKPAEASTALRAEDAAPAARPSRKLPIRSSPVSTAPSLRSSLTALGKKRAPKAAPTQAPLPETPPFVQKVLLQELEPRLLLSADLNPFAGDALLATPSTLPAEFRALTEVGKPSVVTTAAVAPVQRSNELVFVDTATPE